MRALASNDDGVDGAGNALASVEAECRDWRAVAQYDGRVVPMPDPRGRTLSWFTVVPIHGASERTDRWAIERGRASLTPLRLDLTDEERLLKRLSAAGDDAPGGR